MGESQDRSGWPPPEVPRALLLGGEARSACERNLAQLLSFFGIPWIAVTAGEAADAVCAQAGRGGGACVLASAGCVAEAMRGSERPGGGLPRWMTEARSVYIHGLRGTDEHEGLLRRLTGDAGARVRGLDMPGATVSVTSGFPEMCGPMSGMRVPIQAARGGCMCGVPHPKEGFQSILGVEGGEMFFGVRNGAARCYVSACSEIVDLAAPSPVYFDVKKAFYEAVPVAMYLKWAFRDVCWASPETSACLIVDDPPLKPRYGRLEFREALALMERFGFTLSLAFIPWNWRRTDRGTVSLLRERPESFSLAFHGCDHGAGEFAARSSAVLNARIKRAKQRMESLHERTSLRYDRVMVFPQGAFSPETGHALKLNGFVAAVNTEVAPVGGDANETVNETTIGDLWDVAIMKYGTFPIYTRRYLSHGIENFAFDMLLGKPCLIASHHDAFGDGGQPLIDFIAKLQSLGGDLRWRPLGDAISRSFKVRNLADGTRAVRMFGKELAMEAHGSEARETVFTKEEDHPDCVRAVTVNETPMDFGHDAGRLQFRAALPEGVAKVRVSYFDTLPVGPEAASVGYRVRTRARRYLSEFRDHYVSRSGVLDGTAKIVKRALGGGKTLPSWREGA